MKFVLLVVIAVGLPIQGHAQESQAQPCVIVEGDRILAKDLAARVPLFAVLEPELPIAPSPAPGVRRVMNTSELRMLARRHQLPDASTESVCFAQPMEQLSEARVLEAVRKALKDFDGAVEILDFSKFPVPRGELEFEISRAGAPGRGDSTFLWRGRLRYGQSRSLPIWARVRVNSVRRQVVAARDLPAGKPIAAGDLTEESVQGIPMGEAFLTSIQEVAGAVPGRSIRRGATILTSMLQAPNEVQKGDLVTVEVRSGSARLAFEGRAETAAPKGGPVLVKNPLTGKRFTAFVESSGKVTVHTGQGE